MPENHYNRELKGEQTLTLSTTIRRLSTPVAVLRAPSAAANRGPVMAYNPFNIFRRNQKAIFAVITVFIMFTFVLSSGMGKGDFFEVFADWLGARGSKGDHLCTIDGHKVYERELNKLRFQRVMA